VGEEHNHNGIEKEREREERVKMPICTKKVNATTTEAMRRNGSDN
jgi:hypothetical protein